MKSEQKQLLTRCLELTHEVEAHEPPKWQRFDWEDWAEQMKRGPRYLIARWFGPTCERDRMRYRRAVDALESAGLLTTWRNGGLRLSHVQLTDAGRELATQLRREAAVDG